MATAQNGRSGLLINRGRYRVLQSTTGRNLDQRHHSIRPSYMKVCLSSLANHSILNLTDPTNIERRVLDILVAAGKTLASDCAGRGGANYTD
jgi:hypothetical protein